MVEDVNPAPPEAQPQRDGWIEHPSVHFEPTDARYRAVIIVMAAVLVIGAIQFTAIWWFFGAYNRHESAIKQSPYPLAPEPDTKLPANPRLEQVDRMAKIETPNVYLREESKEKVLNSIGPTADRGFVYIPISRAMKLVVEQLPVRKEPQQRTSKDNGLVDSGESNSGRMFREGTR